MGVKGETFVRLKVNGVAKERVTSAIASAMTEGSFTNLKNDVRSRG